MDDEGRERAGNGDGGPSGIGSEEKTPLQSQIDGKAIDDVKARGVSRFTRSLRRLHIQDLLGFAHQHLKLQSWKGGGDREESFR